MSRIDYFMNCLALLWFSGTPTAGQQARAVTLTRNISVFSVLRGYWRDTSATLLVTTNLE